MNKLNPKYFFFGLIIAILSLSMAGWRMTTENIFANFSRFHLFISPVAQYFPTSRQLMALTRGTVSKNKIIVLIGGSSVMRGTGQGPDDLWSTVLQKELGDKYQVLNLALNGGNAGGQALYMTEALAAEEYKVIFISDAEPFTFGLLPNNVKIYSGMFFDALERGYIKPFPERIDYVTKVSYAQDPGMLSEHQLKAMLNSQLNFDDLWAYLGYQHFFTIWTQFTANSSFSYDAPWKPRKVYGDTEINCDLSRNRLFLKEEMKIIRDAINAAPLENDIDEALSATIPSALKDNTLFIIKSYSPFYLRNLSVEERGIFDNKLLFAQKIYESLGISTVIVLPNFKTKDFCDRNHLSESGGKIFAKTIAPYVTKKARELGYE